MPDKMTRISNAENIRHFESLPTHQIEGFGDQGDFARQHLLNPTLFRMLGDVGGKSILDAGCGQQTYGYRFHRPLSQYLNTVIQYGCRIAEIVEPQLDASFEQQDRIYARNVHVPAFIIVHAVKNEA